MLIFLIAYNVIAAVCILYAVFNYKDVLSWVWVKSKSGCLWLWNWIRGFLK